ncbi:MAG TPA: dephospho-CoA kinase [Verrucomicrobiota bacterium]|nr:dephospho-CoA kinase [Verrucomicrobiota bacterium]HNT15045.1 dephospho-CoA kinase [Verrucomicrobiota bacterium]
MKVMGLTGGVGMGKSTVAHLLQARGHAVVDTDVLARQIVRPGTPALTEIVAAFGPELLDDAGGLRREALARLVFADTAARKRLEAITHPRIRELWQTQLRAWQAESRAVAAVVIPLLYETQAASAFDVVVCVACSLATQEQRLIARGWSREQIEQRRAAQFPVQEKMERANYVIWTEGLPRHTEAQLDRLLSGWLAA